MEKKHIELLGGNISNNRVIWKRKVHHDTSSRIDMIPLLNMTRSLGDFWSCTDDNDYLISPVPDVYVHYFNFKTDKFLILGSDGLWDVMKPQEVVEELHAICTTEFVSDRIEIYRQGAHLLIEKALDPVSTVVTNWNNWIPKIFHKARVEAMNHKKTFKDYIPVILSCTDQPMDYPCKSIVFKLYYYTHLYAC